jgi:hypothetical protein
MLVLDFALVFEAADLQRQPLALDDFANHPVGASGAGGTRRYQG